MKNKISRKEAGEMIREFFSKKKFGPGGIRKIKKLAMRYNIKLREYKKKFCKKCLCELRGKIRLGKKFKTIECEKCRYKNRFSLKRKD